MSARSAPLDRAPKFRRRAEARPDEVLDAALDLFIEKGFAATRVEDIASRAGLSKGAVYLYFASKEAILEGLVKRAVVPIANNALAVAENYAGDPRTVITLAMKTLAGHLGEARIVAIPKLMMREMINFPEFAAMYRTEVLDRVLPTITRMLKRGIDEGYLRPVDPELTIRSIVGPILLHILLDEVFSIRPKDGLGIDRLVDNHLTILFDGLSAPNSDKRFMAG
ncbi:MAG: TetR/AcrR family transcriptional regulator [Devosia sp.]